MKPGGGHRPCRPPLSFPERIAAQAQVVVAYARRRERRQNLVADGRAEAQRNGGMAFLEQFPGQEERAQGRMHQPGHRKGQAVAALEIEGDNGRPTPGGQTQGRIMPVRITDAPPFLPMGNRTRRKNGHRPSILQMAEGFAQALHVALRGFPPLKGVHVNKRPRQGPQGSEEAVDPDPQSGAQGRQPRQKDQALQQSERMVGNKNQRPLPGHERKVAADPDAQRGQGTPSEVLRGLRIAKRPGEGVKGPNA